MSKGKINALNAILQSSILTANERTNICNHKDDLMRGNPFSFKIKNQRQKRKLQSQTR